MSFVVGIDPSLACTAVCLSVDPPCHRKPMAEWCDKHGERGGFMGHTCGYDGIPYAMHTCGSQATERSVIRRIERFEDLVARVMKPIEAAGVADVICIEGYAHMANTGHQHALAEFGGILRFHLVEFSAQIYEVPPSTLKKFCCGSGAPGKVGVAVALSKDYAVNFGGDDNRWDAFGLYRMALVLAGAAEAKTRAQREAIDTVLGLKPSKADKAQRRVERLLSDDHKLPF